MEYRQKGLELAESPDGPIILLGLFDERDQLSLLVDPEWRRLVEEEDLDYLECLLGDFVERAEQHPALLFKQLFSLNVGPLVARGVGSSLSDPNELTEMLSRFTPFSHAA